MIKKITKSPSNNTNGHLIIFTKYPVPGETKTRLIPLLGPTGAADLQKRMAEKTFLTTERFAKSHDVTLEVCFENGTEKKMKAWLGRNPTFSPQPLGDIGLRMHHSILNAFQSGHSPVVLIGTDIPDITGTILNQAFSLLKKNDLVLGPSTDGGYWLIGLAKPADVFNDIQWSTRSVLQQTVNIAKKLYLKYHLLNKLTDIDTEKSLKKVLPEEANRKPYISVIIPTFNESGNIKTAIDSAKYIDTEIIVVDGGSIDDTVEKARESGAHVITGPKGRARQQNFGAKRALGKVLLFLHADTLLPEDYTSYVFDALMDKRVAAGAFKFKTDYSHPFMTLVELGANIRSKFFNLPYGDQALFLYKTTFNLMDGFPDVAIAEDLYITKKLSSAGKIVIVPIPIVTSGRRWKKRGPIRTWLINTIILAGCKLGISPKKLKSLYKIPNKKN